MNKAALVPLLQTVRRRRARLHLRQASAAGKAQPITAAMGKALLDRPAPSEQRWIDRIEEQRRALLESTESFQLQALGAKSTGTSERSIGRVTGSASKPPRWAYLLFRVVRELRPVECIELGACVGITAAYQAAALEVNGAGSLLTIEGTPALAEQSRKTLGALGLAARTEVVTGAFVDVLPPVLEQRSGRVDYVFIDGHHDGVATLAYLDQILPHLADQALLAFDDINWSDDMREAWHHIVHDERFAWTVDLQTIGYALWQRDRGRDAGANLRLSYA